MAAQTPDAGDLDPKGLIRESYRIDGIGLPECRSIFLDWAISVPAGADARALIPGLLSRYAEAAPDHPMSQVLRDGLADPAPMAGRRGGARARRDPPQSRPTGGSATPSSPKPESSE